MDLLRPQAQKMRKDWCNNMHLTLPNVYKKIFYASLLAAYTIDEVKKQLQGIPFATVHIQTVSDRHFVVWGYTS